MTRPKLLDLFGGAQGCGVGYARAEFEVTSVDIDEHDRHPEISEFVASDALEVLRDLDYLNRFDVVHASPPCQAYTTMSNRKRGDWPDLLGPVREALLAWGGVYVIENVPGARRHMHSPVQLHGGMFGLGVSRPRLFESNVTIKVTRAPYPKNPLGVYGKLDGRRLWTRVDGTEQRAAKTLAEAQVAMGIDWMVWDDLREAVPPAYTEWVGRQLMEQIDARALAA